MLDKYYDSYGYKSSESFITTAEIKNIKFPPSKTISQQRSEIESFFSETGQGISDLNQSPLLMKPIPEQPINYKKKYLTFEALEDGDIFFVFNENVKSETLSSISYSTDNGETWILERNPYKNKQQIAVLNGGNPNQTIYNESGNTDDESGYELDETFGDTIIDDMEHSITSWESLFGKKSDNGMVTINVVAGDKVLFKGSADSFGVINGTTVSKCHFGSNCKVDVYGNIMSLCYEDDFYGKYELLHDCQFDAIFAGTDIVNSKNLMLPATELTLRCYEYMFSGCTSLITTPELPAMTLAPRCYQDMFCVCPSLRKAPKLPAMEVGELCYQAMFSGCTSLTEAPNLPATKLDFGSYVLMFSACSSLKNAPNLPARNLGPRCYQSMFRTCTSLTKAPELPATNLTEACYLTMFHGCSSLNFTPDLKATEVPSSGYCGMFEFCTKLTTTPRVFARNLSDYCYMQMFMGCTSLTETTELPVTELYHQCYSNMFSGCTSLTTAPELPATTMARWCYSHMFGNCTSLTTAPELPATTLENNCYRSMFAGCSSLNYVKCLADTLEPENAFTNWLTGVSSSGTFVKKRGIEWSSGYYGIPEGWEVEEVD